MVDYYDYLDSPEWEEKTKYIRLRNKGICECCNMRFGENVHHRTYERVFNEQDSDLLHVCSYCHKAIHRIEPTFVWPSRMKLLEQLQKEADKWKKS